MPVLEREMASGPRGRASGVRKRGSASARCRNSLAKPDLHPDARDSLLIVVQQMHGQTLTTVDAGQRAQHVRRAFHFEPRSVPGQRPNAQNAGLRPGRRL